jgi:tight adherence protein C
MILLLLIGIALAGVASALIARATLGSGTGETQPVARIRRYGFTRSRGDQAKAAVGGIVGRAAESVGARLASHPGKADELRRNLVQAGIYRVTPGKFLGYRILAAVGLPLIWIWLSTSNSMSAFATLVGLLACAGIGWWVPAQIVKDRARRRLTEIDYELPELIDLLVVTIEAGLGFVGSLQMAAKRLEGPLGDELRLTLQEQNMGLSINEALHNTMMRADTPAMRSFVRSVTQGERLGVSIGQIMRDLAGEMRRRRKQSAEERAQKAPIKILFPLVFLIFPAMFIVLLGPALIQFIHAISGIGQG